MVAVKRDMWWNKCIWVGPREAGSAQWVFMSTSLEQGSPLGQGYTHMHYTQWEKCWGKHTFLVARHKSPRSCCLSSSLRVGAFLPGALLANILQQRDRKTHQPFVEAGRKSLKIMIFLIGWPPRWAQKVSAWQPCLFLNECEWICSFTENDSPSACFHKVVVYHSSVQHIIMYNKTPPSSAVDFTCQTGAILVIFSMGGYCVLSHPHSTLL